MRNWAASAISLVFICLLFIVPLAFPPQYLYLFDLTQIYAILAVSLGFTVGYAGLLSVAHAVFFGMGAYFTGLSMIAGLSFLPSLMLAGCSAFVVALAVGVPALRTRGVYFAITTLCLTIIFEMILNNWVSLTRGTSGLGGIPKPEILGFQFRTGKSFHYLISIVAVLCGLILYKIMNSEIGRTMLAIREQKSLSKMSGINTFKYELINFSIGALFAGISGNLYAVYIRYLNPSDFGIQQCFDVLAMVVVGGTHSIAGPIMGAFFISFFPELIGIEPTLKRVAYGTIIILVVVFMPYGIYGLLRKRLAGYTGKRSTCSSAPVNKE